MSTVFIVEDERHLLEMTKEMVEELGYQVCGTSTSIGDAYAEILARQPAILLLDVEVGNQTSFELLSMFKSVDFKIIFITAHQKYALDAFRFSAVDFLLKPLGFTPLEAALKKAVGTPQETQEQAIATLQHNLQSSQEEQKIILKTQDKIWVLPLLEIIHCESDLSYTIFHTDSERIIVSKTMGYYEELLSTYGFYRVHKSHLINLRHVRRIHKSEGGTVELTNGSTVPISQRKRDEFFKLIDTQGLA